MVDGVIFKSDQIAVPKSIRREVLKKIHLCHLGVEKTKLKGTGGIILARHD